MNDWKVGEIVKIKHDGGLVMAVDPRTQKTTQTPQLFKLYEEPMLDPYPMSSADYEYRLNHAGTVEVFWSITR